MKLSTYLTSVFYLALLILCHSCAENQKAKKNIEPLNNLNPQVQAKVFKSIEDFLASMPETELPYEFNPLIFSVEKYHEMTKEPSKLVYRKKIDNCENYFPLRDSLSILIENRIVLPFQIKSCDIREKIKINDSIDAYLANAQNDTLIISTLFTKQKGDKIIDYVFLTVEENLRYDLYYDTGILIDSLGFIETINYVHYESPLNIFKKKFKLLPSGKIKTLYKKIIDQGDCENFDDYINDYTSTNQTSISLNKEERQTYFNKLLALTPNVSLPYNSGDFYHYMAIENPDKNNTTQLFHEGLKKPEKVAFFISKNKLSAFKDNKEGNFFYPIFRFNRTPDIITIGFLYQSYCNYNKAIYVKLVNYNPQGNIVDEWIVDRRFFSGDCRVLSSIEFLEDFTVKLKRYIQNFEGYGYEGYEENDGRNAKQFQEVYTITENGEFKKK